jgi:hypothetical protein
MPAKILILLALPMAACQFVVGGLPQAGSGDLGPQPPSDAGVADLAQPAIPDLAGSDPGAPDLAKPDVPPVNDPCQVPPGNPTNATVAHCVIDSPPLVDGNLADWPDPLFTTRLQHRSADDAPGSWSGNEDNNDVNLSARVATRWDRYHLYVAVHFADDSGYLPSSAYYRGDSIEVYFDALRDQLASSSTDGMRLILIRDATGQAYKLSAPASALPLPTGVVARALANPTGSGFQLEVAIPWSALGAQKPAPGQFLGFDVSLNDADNGDPARERSLLFKNTAPPGCTCSNGLACAPYCSAQALWTLTLGGR